MSSVVISGDTSGTVTVTVPAVAGTNTVTIPAVTGTAVVSGQNSAITVGTAVASTSGTSIDFTGIPSWVKRITVMFNSVRTSGSSVHLIQLGAGSIQTSGYNGSGGGSDGASGNGVTVYTQGIGIEDLGNSSLQLSGAIVIRNFGSNLWVSSHVMGSGAIQRAYWGGSSVTLSGTLDRVRITTVNGTDTFNLGSINIQYE